jgi:hypothetical protein
MSMPVSEYKLIAGTIKQVEVELVQLAMKGWKPILMSSLPAGSASVTQLTIVVELAPGASK